ncbi:MAG: hypothetical protein ABIR94_17045, partial [Rubrivivax sp.]
MRKPALNVRRTLVAAAALAAMGPMPAMAANVTWVGPNASFWDLAANWSSFPLIASDNLVFGAFNTEFRSGSVSVSDFSGTGALTISGGALNISAASAIGGLTMTGGTLDGTGALSISGASSWTGGGMSGTGSTVFNGALALGGVGLKDITQRTIT